MPDAVDTEMPCQNPTEPTAEIISNGRSTRLPNNDFPYTLRLVTVIEDTMEYTKRKIPPTMITGLMWYIIRAKSSSDQPVTIVIIKRAMPIIMVINEIILQEGVPTIMICSFWLFNLFPSFLILKFSTASRIFFDTLFI